MNIEQEIGTVYDSETTGFANKKTPDDDPSQPHLVQLAAIQFHIPTRQVMSTLNCMIYPDGWGITKGAEEVHGISIQKAEQFGIQEEVALDIFMGLQQNALRIAHNEPFDYRIIEIAVARYGGKKLKKHWAREGDRFCTMKESKTLTHPNNLAAVHKALCGGGEFEAHDAMADARVCMDIFFAIMDAKQ